ncbi:glycoside hydrolase family 13 protein [Thermogladius sp. 4427co]|uniref:glycoside hydrolase family 13 protein n=1 Tax=Thermogladius sp. 4427co TaxID=3450718 RepID=UPI003F78EB27
MSRRVQILTAILQLLLAALVYTQYFSWKPTRTETTLCTTTTSQQFSTSIETTPLTTTRPTGGNSSTTAAGQVITTYLYQAREGFLFNYSNPAFLSAADGGVVLRLTLPEGLYDRVYAVVNNSFIEMKKQLYWTSYEMWYGRVEGVGPFTYYFVLVKSDGSKIVLYNSTETPLFYFDGVDRFPQVGWVPGAVGYQIFPDRFYNGDPSNDLLGNSTDELWFNAYSNTRPVFSKWSDPITPLHCCHQYFGGDIKGIILKLGYLKSLGVDMIYLNPIFLSGSVHGYDTYDYMVVDPKYGTQEDVRNLIIRAHELGIRIIFDFVPDHVGLGFWAFQDVYRNGPASKYWNWFTIYKWPFKLGDSSAYRCWWGFGSLPQLNTSNPEVRDYLYRVALYWMDFGFDGMRIDTPTDLLNAREFFEGLRNIIKSKYPQAYIVGEVWSLDPSWLQGDTFDSLMNYYLGRDILLAYAQGKLSGRQAGDMLSIFYASIGVNVAGMGFNVIDSHDTSRILTDLGGGRLGDTPSYESIQRLKLLTTLQFAMPGMPVIFQGDERGLLGDKSHYDEERYPIQWNYLIPDVYNHYLALSSLKHSIPALKTSIIRLIYTSDHLLVFTRGYNDEVIVVANNGYNNEIFTLPEGNWMIVYPYSGSVILSGSITVKPLSVIVLVKES